MKRSDRAKAKKKKERQERLRREKHERASLPAHEGEPDDLRTEDALPPEAPFLEERALRRALLLDRARDEGRLELDGAELDQLDEERLGRIAAGLVEADPREKAQELAFESLAAERRKDARKLARAALELDPDCADALAVLAAIDSNSDEEAVRRMELALEAGARALGGEPFFERNRGRFWSEVATRPYLRTREALADLLRQSGRTREAAAHYEAMLELDRDDGIGVRHSLLGALLELGELEGVRRHLERDPDGDLAASLWARALERFLSGDCAGAARAVRAARAQNSQVELVLLGLDPLREETDDFTLEERTEALEVELRLGEAWRRHAEAFDWLEEGALATSAAEREAAIASYREPAAALLIAGEPAPGDWVHDEGLVPFSAEDLPELERMALDRGLNELGSDHPAVWAPLHALRALARLRAVESVPVFLRLARETEETDDWLMEDVPAALALAGAAALEPCIALLCESRERVAPRSIAAITLLLLAKQGPDLREPALAGLTKALSNHRHEPQRLNDLLALEILALEEGRSNPLLREAVELGSVSPFAVHDLERGTSAGDR